MFRNTGILPKSSRSASCFPWLRLFALRRGWGPSPDLIRALKAGALAGFGFVAVSFGINYQFAQRSFKLWLIDGGYHTGQFLIFGLVLGLWP